MNFVMFNNRIVSRSFSCSIIDEASWKKLFHFNMMANFNNGCTACGNKNFKKYQHLSSKNYKRVTNNLVSKHFIKTKPIAQKLTSTAVLMFPYCNPAIQKTYPFNNGQFQTKTSLVASREHFTQVPYEAMERMLLNRSLYVVHLRLMIKLYQYSSQVLFAGVDPNVIHFINGELIVAERLLFDLDLTKELLLDYLEDLGRAQLISINNIALKSITVGNERRLIHSDSEYEKTAYEIITPLYKYERKCDNEPN